MNGDRKTIAVCHCHDLGPFPTFRRSNVRTPLFAPAKVASIKHSDRSIFPLLRKSSAKAFKSVSITPSATHFWNHRWQVWYEGYREGRSFQGAPVRIIQRMPFKTSLGFRAGRPRKGSVDRLRNERLYHQPLLISDIHSWAPWNPEKIKFWRPIFSNRI